LFFASGTNNPASGDLLQLIRQASREHSAPESVAERAERSSSVDQTEIFEKVIKILTPYVKNQEALEGVTLATHILDDLKVNSARLVDVVLEFEDAFDIEIDDDDVDKVETVGNAVELIEAKIG
jgi:acyl carrier protein